MIEFKLPSLGADMDEGMLIAWLIAPGDTVERGQVVAEVETDKGIIEVECWEDGYVDRLLLEPSSTKLSVGTPIAVLRSPGEAAPDERIGVADVVERAVAEPDIVEDDDVVAVASASPPIRHLAHELGVDIGRLERSGGEVTRDDVRRAAEPVAATVAVVDERPRVTPRARRNALDRGIDLGAITPSRSDGLIVAQDLPSNEETSAETHDPRQAMRRAIARSMERSKREIPHYYLGDQIDLEVALRWLDEVNEDRSLTKRILPAALLLRAVTAALGEIPDLNGHWVDGAFIQSDKIHLGVAVSLRTGGLVAPAILDAGGLSLDEMMVSLTDLVARARSGRLRSSEMSDATVTVTSLGDRGVDTVFPIIVPPQVAMVGLGKIAQRPVVVDGDVVAHTVVEASLTADHRVTDGHRGGLFLLALDRLLQEPESL
jgi:pyruvate dehydrogenase E2 component (dihydrolipoamide acetyltransferase)